MNDPLGLKNLYNVFWVKTIYEKLYFKESKEV